MVAFLLNPLPFDNGKTELASINVKAPIKQLLNVGSAP